MNLNNFRINQGLKPIENKYICQYCGTKFIPKMNKIKYCNNKCYFFARGFFSLEFFVFKTVPTLYEKWEKYNKV